MVVAVVVELVPDTTASVAVESLLQEEAHNHLKEHNFFFRKHWNSVHFVPFTFIFQRKCFWLDLEICNGSEAMRLDSSSEGGEATELTLNSTQESWIWAGYMWEQNHGDTMFVRQSSMAAVHLATRISRNECRKFGKEMRRCRTSTSSAAASSSSIRGIRTVAACTSTGTKIKTSCTERIT
ncbi:hypothetical protein Y032_0031g2269 [Ancylostoma ceylanicum]|uniref:Uncharacterized protein n=2 Tax=Ancylostoma ceylanicum TaxID=53326 RepID=A0A016UQJ5_9BILA|nr:hypothetical protein Y032_0031g2269 [Ancylostoma ceylanicum]